MKTIITSTFIVIILLSIASFSLKNDSFSANNSNYSITKYDSEFLLGKKIDNYSILLFFFLFIVLGFSFRKNEKDIL